jgi:hypothetical protein
MNIFICINYFIIYIILIKHYKFNKIYFILLNDVNWNIMIEYSFIHLFFRNIYLLLIKVILKFLRFILILMFELESPISLINSIYWIDDEHNNNMNYNPKWSKSKRNTGNKLRKSFHCKKLNIYQILFYFIHFK